MSPASHHDPLLDDLEAVGLSVTEFTPTAPDPNGTPPPAEDPPPTETPRRGRRWLRLGLFATAGLFIAAAAFLYDPRKLFDDEAGSERPNLRDTATVALADLGDAYEADGNVVFAASMDVRAVGPPGVVNEIVSPGSTVTRGTVLWRVVDEPTVALLGDIPAHRSLNEGDVGPDVRQLEDNLVALGYDPDSTVTVDDTFTANTALMVERWQEDIGAEVSGSVPDGAVVYVPQRSRTGAVAFGVGDTLTTESIVLTVTAPDRVVEFVVPASERDTLAVGDVVNARLPDRTTFEATVVGIEIQATGGASISALPLASIDYVIDVVPVAVSWSVAVGSDVLTVPASALIRTDSGQYYVEVRSPAGAERFVPVEIGRSSGVTVEVIGAVTEGETVIAP